MTSAAWPLLCALVCIASAAAEPRTSPPPPLTDIGPLPGARAAIEFAPPAGSALRVGDRVRCSYRAPASVRLAAFRRAPRSGSLLPAHLGPALPGNGSSQAALQLPLTLVPGIYVIRCRAQLPNGSAATADGAFTVSKLPLPMALSIRTRGHTAEVRCSPRRPGPAVWIVELSVGARGSGCRALWTAARPRRLYLLAANGSTVGDAFPAAFGRLTFLGPSFGAQAVRVRVEDAWRRPAEVVCLGVSYSKLGREGQAAGRIGRPEIGELSTVVTYNVTSQPSSSSVTTVAVLNFRCPVTPTAGHSLGANMRAFMGGEDLGPGSCGSCSPSNGKVTFVWKKAVTKADNGRRIKCLFRSISPSLLGVEKSATLKLKEFSFHFWGANSCDTGKNKILKLLISPPVLVRHLRPVVEQTMRCPNGVGDLTRFTSVTPWGKHAEEIWDGKTWKLADETGLVSPIDFSTLKFLKDDEHYFLIPDRYNVINVRGS